MEKVKVMIVDDSKVSRLMIQGQLARTNFEVCALAKNAAEAVQLYEELRPTLVTMDMNLPDADGIECSRRIKAIDASAKIVMISAMKDVSLSTKGREVGISAFLQKPVNPNELIDTLMSLCQMQLERVVLLRETYVKAFSRGFQDSMVNIIGVDGEVEVAVDERHFLEVDGIAVIIGLTGTPAGRAIVYMDWETARRFACRMLGMEETDELPEDEVSDSIEEAANMIAGRSSSNVNDIYSDKEMRITPPGTISGKNIRIVSPKLTTFKLEIKTNVGSIFMNVGFAEGE